MKITISGLSGSGKSTVGKLIAKKLGYKFYSIGDIRGQMAMDKGITIDELNKLGETEDWTDKEADARTKKIGETEDNFIIDARLAYHFIPDAVKIFLTVDPKIGAERIFKNQRIDEEKKETVEELQKTLEDRRESNKKRYKKWYGIDFPDTKNFDLVIDTKNITIEDTVNKILDFLKTKGLNNSI